MIRANPRSTTGPNKPRAVPAGTKLACLTLEPSPGFKSPKTISEFSIYIVQSYEAYYNSYRNGIHKWDEFVVILNDFGKPIKCNMKRFKILNYG